MARKFDRSEPLVIASHNTGKVREIRALLTPLGLTVTGAAELGLAEPDETGKTFIENAVLKAQTAAQTSQRACLADDSGFCVNALGGAPGIYSARWAGPDKDFTHAMQRVSEALLLSGSKDRSSVFVCALALAWPDGHFECFEGRLSGQVTWPPRGSRGFGYDPIFTPSGHDQTFGEMDPEEKHQMSHRALAFNQLLENCLIF